MGATTDHVSLIKSVIGLLRTPKGVIYGWPDVAVIFLKLSFVFGIAWLGHELSIEVGRMALRVIYLLFVFALLTAMLRSRLALAFEIPAQP